MMFSLLVVVAICCFQLSLCTNSPCPCGWSKIEGNCYKFFVSQDKWDNARSTCLGQGGDLALPTRQTNALISKFARNGGSRQTWVGIFRRYEKRFINVEGRDQVYTNWNSGEPNNSGGNENCVVMYTNTARWNDASCSSNHDFVCEIKLW
ncbi:Hypothetical predicted protein [Paramuricea clavata]|uniref:Uncharacterized protein n=1 Tax=Paramuricea clavata TaxID=317549 RepID=A0A7D9EXQ2_PARCT|nr:Hypothetical predicted protein [Paramuricea clavata]